MNTSAEREIYSHQNSNGHSVRITENAGAYYVECRRPHPRFYSKQTYWSEVRARAAARQFLEAGTIL